MTTTKISPELSEMDARDLPDCPDIQQAATLLVAEVVAEGDPSERPELPTGTKGCFGCLLPLALVSVYGWVSEATGPTVATFAGLLNYLCCSVVFSIGRFREFRAITRRVKSAILRGDYSAHAAVSSLLVKAARSNPNDPSWVGLRAERRLEALRDSRDILPEAVIVAERAMAGEAPLGQPVSLERPSPSYLGLLISLPLVLGGVYAGTSNTLALPTIVVGVVGGISMSLAFDAGRYGEFRDACDRVRDYAGEVAYESSPAANSLSGQESPTGRRD